MQSRVISFVDGLNLYHSIRRLEVPYLHWIDLPKLSNLFISTRREHLSSVLYFSSVATHLPNCAQVQQKTYFDALRLRNITLILGSFKKKELNCSCCSFRQVSHEEKKTDVNLAIQLLDLAYQGAYDRALVFSNDSDLVPSLEKVLQRFPEKRITVISPPASFRCKELLQKASDTTVIRPQHLERCLLPEVVFDVSGSMYVRRPREYAPSPRLVELGRSWSKGFRSGQAA